MQGLLTHKTKNAQAPGDHQQRNPLHPTERGNVLAW